MKLRLLTFTAAAVLSGCMCSCKSTLPEGSSITVGTGKQTVSVDASGKSWKEVLREASETALRVGGRLLVNMAVTYAEEKLGSKSGRQK